MAYPKLTGEAKTPYEELCKLNRNFEKSACMHENLDQSPC